jgi:hypothetical protein
VRKTCQAGSCASAAFDRQVLQYQRGEQIELPVSVKLAVGRKTG